MAGGSAEETRITVLCTVPCTSVTRSQLDNLCLSATSLQLHVRLCQHLTKVTQVTRADVHLNFTRPDRTGARCIIPVGPISLFALSTRLGGGGGC